MKHRMGLTARTVLLFYMVVLILITGLSTCFSIFISRSATESLLSSVSWSIEQNTIRVRDILNRIDIYMGLMNNDDETMFKMLMYEGDELQTISTYKNLYSLLNNTLSTAVGNSVNVVSHFFVNPQMALSKLCPNYRLSMLRVSSYGTRAIVSNQTYFTDEEWFKAAAKAEGESLWCVIPGLPDRLSLAREIRYTRIDNGRVKTYILGTLLVTFEAGVLFDNLYDNKLTESASVIISCNGNVMYGDKALSVYTALGQNQSERLKIDGHHYYVRSAELDEHGLVITCLIPLDRIEALKTNTSFLIIAALLIALTIGFVLVVVFSRIVVKPIRGLSMLMQKDEKATMPERPHAPEIVTLYSSYNSLLTRNAALIENVKAKEREKRIMELNLLQAQINPHFIYNTLDTACCMAMLNNDPDIADMLGDLSCVLRYNIKNGDALIPLSAELDIVKRTAHIHRMRMSCRFELNIHCEDAETCLIPKMTLQPLVENSLSYVKELKFICVNARIEDKRLVLTVTDNGTDVNTEELNAHIRGEVTLETRSTGLGVRGVNARVNMRFGDEYGLMFRSDDEGHTIAVLSLPVIYEDIGGE